MTLKPCPCGKTPDRLLINDENPQKWSFVCGDCCNEWHVEFRSNYAVDDDLMYMAIESWNNIPRAVN